MISVDAFLGLIFLYVAVMLLATRNAPREIVALSERAALSPIPLMRVACLCAGLSALLFWPAGIPLVLLLRLASFVLRYAATRRREAVFARSLAQARVCIRSLGGRRS